MMKIGGIILGALVLCGVVWLGVMYTNPASSLVTDTYGYSTTTGMLLEPTSTTSVTNTNNQNETTMKAVVTTNLGTFTLQLSPETTPITVQSFVKLAKEGFYNNTKFHRVIENFMIQGGDPLSKDDAQAARWGTGGPGYTFNDEITASNKNDVGTISMANSGPNTNGSQFFINVQNNNFLDPKHTVFGKVVEGMDVVLAISTTATNPQDRPLTPVVIEKIDIQE